MRILFLAFLIATNAYAGWFDSEVTKQDLKDVNLLTNAGFENSKAGWNESAGSFTIYTGVNKYAGSSSASWDPTAASQTLTSPQATINTGGYGRDCEAAYAYRDGDANYTIEVIDQSSSVLYTFPAIATASSWQRYKHVFTCPTSGSFGFRLTSTADAAAILLDGFRLAVLDDVNATVSPVEYNSGKTVIGSVGSSGQIAAGHVLTDESFPIATTGNIAFYDLNDLNDDSPNAKNLTDAGTVLFTGTNIFGATTAATFNGTTQSLFSSDSFFNPGDAQSYSYGGWFSADDWQAPNSTLIGNGGDATGTDSGYRLDNASGGKFACRTWSTAGGGSLVDTDLQSSLPGGYTDGDWHHVACVYDVTASTLAMYVDGILVVKETGVAGTRTVTTTDFRIGALRFGTQIQFWAGKSEGVFFARTALSDDDIKKLYSYRVQHNKNVATENQNWSSIWERSDSKITAQLENGYISAIDANNIYWDFSDLDPASSVTVKMSNTAMSATVVPSKTYDTGVLSAAPSFPLSHGLGDTPVEVTVMTEGQSIASQWDYRKDLCSSSNSVLNCDLSSLTIDGTHRLRILASLTPGGSAIKPASATELGTVKKITKSLVRVKLLANQTNVANASGTVIQFNSEEFDTGGDFDTGTYRFTAPRDGYYRSVTNVRWQLDTSWNPGEVAAVVLRRNTLNVAASDYTVLANVGGAYIHNITHTDVVYMTSGEFLDVVAFQTSGVGGKVLESATYWTIEELSPNTVPN